MVDGPNYVKCYKHLLYDESKAARMSCVGFTISLPTPPASLTLAGRIENRYGVNGKEVHAGTSINKCWEINSKRSRLPSRMEGRRRKFP